MVASSFSKCTRGFNVVYKYSNGFIGNDLWEFEGFEDKSTQAIRNCLAAYEAYDTDNIPRILGVESLPNKELGIDWQLLKDMANIRSICDLGRKIRATNNLPIRQPLGTAYVYFSDFVTRANWCYNTKAQKELIKILEEELNLSSIIIVDDIGDNTLFDVTMKPNFRSLGPKGYGKLAQVAKKTLEQLSTDQSNILYNKLLQGPIVDFGFPLSLEDVEVVLKPKDGLKSLSNDSGAIILDTRISDFLKRKGLAYVVKAAIQQVRRNFNLGMQDYVSVKICSTNLDLLNGVKDFAPFIQKECLLSSLSCAHSNKTISSIVNVTSNSCVVVFDEYSIHMERKHN